MRAFERRLSHFAVSCRSPFSSKLITDAVVPTASASACWVRPRWSLQARSSLGSSSLLTPAFCGAGFLSASRRLQTFWLDSNIAICKLGPWSRLISPRSRRPRWQIVSAFLCPTPANSSVGGVSHRERWLSGFGGERVKSSAPSRTSKMRTLKRSSALKMPMPAQRPRHDLDHTPSRYWPAVPRRGVAGPRHCVAALGRSAETPRDGTAPAGATPLSEPRGSSGCCSARSAEARATRSAQSEDASRARSFGSFA